MNSDRPNPDELLRSINAQEIFNQSARLRIFLGMSAGVGKTYSMLKAAHQRQSEGVDIVIGIVETHGRIETASLLEGLEIIPRKKIDYRGTTIEELDVDAIRLRKPEIVVVDELAHSNSPGARHAKRYQDVIELLDAGISVYTALNVQHLESRKDVVEVITQIQIRETVPDSILERASQVELVDIAPDELLKRLKEGKVYLGERAERAADNFFKEDRLTALREIALRITAERVDQDLQKFSTVQQDRGQWHTGERLMVAVSHSPTSEKLIRAARRLAYNLEAPWIAIYIDTGIALSIEDQAQLAKNLTLARELKAEVITTTELEVPAALKRIARQKNVTQIIVGQPARSSFKDFLNGGSLLDRLVHEVQNVAILVVGQEEETRPAQSLSNRLPLFKVSSGPIKYWNTFWFVAFISILSGIVEPYIGYRSVGFIFLTGVMVVGMIGTRGPVILSAFLSAVAWNFFFIPPRLTFMIRDHDDIIMCLAFAIVAVLLGFLTTRIRFHEQLIREREERTNVLYEILREIAQSREKRDFLVKVIVRTGQVLNADCGVFLADQKGKLQFDFSEPYALGLDEKDQAVASWAFQSQKFAGWSTDTLSQAKSLFIPLKGLAEMVGVFVFTPKTSRRLNIEQENLLYSIARQIALALERHFLEKRLLQSQRLQASEELHQTLLNSISHEMRTPLTTIVASASALNEVNSHDPKYVLEVAKQLVVAGDRLNRVIENLLDMSRLNSGVLELKLEWQDIHDLIGVTLSKLGLNLQAHQVKVNLPERIPLVKMDFRFMEHAISNLLLNAAAYSPADTEIIVSAEFADQTLKIHVDDHGSGIPKEDQTRIWEKFYRLPGTPAGGTGLGLSIVKSIVEAHRGHVLVGTNQWGGARFSILLSVEEESPPVPQGLIE
jgi:two-component system sensor histidine kinase KdpD